MMYWLYWRNVKAFDTVDNGILLNNLNNVGVSYS